MDVEHLPGRPHPFEIVPRVVPQTQFQGLSGRGLLDHLGVPFELVAKCGTDEIRAVRVEPLLYHQIDAAQVDVAEIHCNLLGIPRLGWQLPHIAVNPSTIQSPSSWMVYGMGRRPFKGASQLSVPQIKSGRIDGAIHEKWPC